MARSRPLPFRWRMLLLGLLYFAQGLPFGFQTGVLPILLRERGASLTAISFASALALPWLLKWAWAPLVDRFGGGRFGRRRSWILPLQAALALSAALAGFAARDALLWPILGLLFLMNLLAATQDIATDGLAVDTLSARELGPGNTAQVVGYKLGMLTSGGLLLALVGGEGYAPVLFGIAALCALVWLVMLAVPERALVRPGGAVADVHEPLPTSPAPERLRPLIGKLVRALSDPSIRWALVFIATYKTGESMIDVMFKPFLVDAGFTRVQLGLWAGTWGSVASIAGSVAGGVLAMRLTPVRAMGLCALLRVFPLLFQWWLASRGAPQPNEVIAVILAEEAFGGALTTCTFAFMMSLVNRRIGASHYTALATLEVLGKLPAGLIAGPIAQQVGYAALFGLGAALSVAFLPIWLLVQRERRHATAP